MNSGNANQAAIRLLLWSLAALVAFFVAAWIGHRLGGLILSFYKGFIVLWAVFLVAVLYLFRDPNPVEPSDLSAIVSPAHGKVDVIEDTVESEFMRGACKRVSIHVSLWNVQVQYAPVPGTVAHYAYQPARVEGATRHAENLLIGFDAVGRPDTRFALRLTAGTWGRRIVPWVKANDVIARSVRIGMMRPASKVDLYLPGTVRLHVNPGDEVVGGQSVVAKFE